MSAFQPLPGVYYICLAPGITQSCAHMAIRTPHIIAIFNDRCGWKCSHSTTRNPLRIYTFCAVLCAVCLLLYFLSVQHARAYLQRYVSALYGTRSTAAIPCPAYCDLWHFRFGECEMNGSTRNKQNFCSFQVFLLCFFFCISERMVFVWSFRWNRFVRWKYDTGEANLNEIDVVIIGFQWDNCRCWLRCRTKLVWLIYSNP